MINMDLISHLMKMKRMMMKPNFFVSIPYLNFFKAEVISEKGNEWLVIDGEVLFPPVIMKKTVVYPVNHIWTDFVNKKPYGSGWEVKLFDLEYMYNPQDFNYMNGGKWNVFRKNIRKWPKNNPGWYYTNSCPKNKIEALLADWLGARLQYLQDADFIIHCILEKPTGIHCKYLFNSSHELVAINAWDVNYAFINYRFIITNTDKFIDEFARYLFYTDPEIQAEGKLVNDGGILDNIGLMKFKDKLNPVCLRSVNTWNKQ